MSYLDYDDRIKQLEQLAFIDESASYEVDMTGIYKEGAKFVLINASGCSCWDGSYDEDQFDSLDEVEEHLTKRKYGPSLEGIKELMAEARNADAKRKS